MALDCGNQRWNGLLRERGVHRSAIAHVRAGEGWHSITDDFRTVSWDAGTGQLSGGASRSFGRFRKLGRQRSGSIDGTGQVRPTAELSFDTDEARGLVTTVAEGLGLTSRGGTAERVGIVGAVIGGLGALAAIVAVLVGFTLGWF
ncbi:hypothetical protein [uncultured Friedmanniella sp.]|uniref:hypothetical protein n=1 Tax=uncultured Friedmanniella sp. TaxID=335381 RepID=UPI0035C9520D